MPSYDLFHSQGTQPDQAGQSGCASKAPRRELAEKFINFIFDAKIGAQLSDFTRFATPNHAAREFIKPEGLNTPANYQQPEAMAKLELLEDLGANTRL